MKNDKFKVLVARNFLVMTNGIVPRCGDYRYCTASFNKDELRFCIGSNTASGVLKICDVEDF